MLFIGKEYLQVYTFFAPILYNSYEECVCDLDTLTLKLSFPTFQTIETKFIVQTTGVWVPCNSRDISILTSPTWDSFSAWPQKAGNTPHICRLLSVFSPWKASGGAIVSQTIMSKNVSVRLWIPFLHSLLTLIRRPFKFPNALSWPMSYNKLSGILILQKN